jgi:Protein of unknown function (DUF4230)
MLMKNPRRIRSRSMLASFVLIVAVVAVVGVALVSGFRMLGNPFTTETQDRSAPPVLTELRDMAEFHAAQGSYEVTIDVEDDVRWVPGFLAGERVQFIAVGSVDAVVDFSTLDQQAVVIDEDTSTVHVTLGSIELREPVIDHELSHVMNRDRGILDRIGGMFTDNPTSEARLYQMATEKIAAAAVASDTTLVERAQQNTTNMLSAFIGSLGYEHVEVRFANVVASQ